MAATNRNKTTGFLIYPGISMLDLVLIYSILGGLRMVKYQPYILNTDKNPVPTDTPLTVLPQKTLDELPAPNILVVSGGGLPSLSVLGDDKIKRFVHSASQTAEIVITIGTGSLMLAAFGLLDGCMVATHWAYAELLENFGAHYVRDRWIENGKFITATEGIGSLDLGLKLVARFAGEKNALKLQKMAKYDSQLPFGGINWTGVEKYTSGFCSHDAIEMVREAVAGDVKLSQAVNSWIDALM